MRAILRKSTNRSALALAVAAAALFGDPAELSAGVESCSSICNWSCGIQDDAACASAGGSNCVATGCSTSYFYCHDLLAPNLLTCGLAT